MTFRVPRLTCDAQASTRTLSGQRSDNPVMSTVLIQLSGGAGVVRRDDGEIVITGDAGGRGQPLFGRDDYRPVRMGLDEARSIVAGLLPRGAVSVEVLDDRGARVAAEVGGGVYAAILEQPNDHNAPVVCCRDGSGEPFRVRFPLTGPAPWSPTPRSPAPAAVPWPTTRSSGPMVRLVAAAATATTARINQTRSPSAASAATKRGAGRSITRFGSTDDEPEDEKTAAERAARRRADQRIQKWYVDKLTLRGVAFPIYSAENWHVQIGDGFGTRAKLASGPSKSTGAEVSHLTIDHFTSDADRFTERPRLKVMTSVDRAQFGHTPLEHARWVWPRGHLDRRRRERRRHEGLELGRRRARGVRPQVGQPLRADDPALGVALRR
jgi:hypothetical protein